MVVLSIFAIASCSTFPNSSKEKNQMTTQPSLDNIPVRDGERPQTTPTNPHMQLNQQPEDLSHIKNLMDWAFQLGYVKREPSRISVPGSIAMCLEDEHTCKGCNAFMVGTEFAHFHPHPDHSMHLGLPQDKAEIFIEKGWGEWHPMIKRGILPPNIIMMYAPRTQEELEVAKFILGASYAYAKRTEG